MSCSIPILTATVAGEDYDLNSEDIRLLDYDLGMYPVRRLSQRSPLQIGDTDLGFKIDPRYSDFMWGLDGSSLPDYRDLRAVLFEVFQPRDDDPVLLTFDFGDRVRALYVNLEGTLLFRDRVEDKEKASGVFKSSDPRLFDPTLHTEIFDLAGSSGSNQGWPIPWPIPWRVGTDVINLTISIVYAGASRIGAVEYPVIRIIGPITDPVITNQTTNEKIDLSDNGGLVLADSAEWVEIDLSSFPRRDSKTIRNQDGESADEYLTTDSDLATFHLAPAGEKLFDESYCTGTNQINVTGTGVDATTQVILSYYNRYIAV